jgi:hypothetical protein
MKKELETQRDELAAHLQLTNQFHEAMGYNHSKAFKDGFNACHDKMIEEVDRVRKLLADLVESKALQEAPFYNYSEAVANAKEFLAVQ